MAASKATTKSSAKVTTESATGASEVAEVKSTTYKVIETFKDLDGQVYVAGNTYPAEDANVSKERYHSLLTKENRMKRPFIKEELEG